MMRFWGGKRTIERGLQNQFCSGLSPFPPKKMTGREQTGGLENLSSVGGAKTVFGEGFFGMFSPPLSFPPPPFIFLGETAH